MKTPAALLARLKRRSRRASYSTERSSSLDDRPPCELLPSDGSAAAAAKHKNGATISTAAPDSVPFPASKRDSMADASSSTASYYYNNSTPSPRNNSNSKRWSPASWRSSAPSPSPHPHGSGPGKADDARTFSPTQGASSSPHRQSRRLSWLRPSSASPKPSTSSHRYSIAGYYHSKLPEHWSSHTQTDSSTLSSSQPSPFFRGRGRFASEDTSATTLTWDSRSKSPTGPGRRPASQQQQQPLASSTGSVPVQGWFEKTLAPLSPKKRSTMNSSTASAPTSHATDATPSLRWRDPWATQPKNNRSFVAALGTEPITTSSSSAHPQPASTSAPTGPATLSPSPSYRPLFGPHSVFSKSLTQGEEQYRPFITRSGSSDMRISPQLQRSNSHHSPSPNPEQQQQQQQQQPQQQQKEQKSSSNTPRTKTQSTSPSHSTRRKPKKSSTFRRPRSASFSDLRTAAKDAAKRRHHPEPVPPLPSSPSSSKPMQYFVEPVASCLPPMSARPRLRSLDVGTRHKDPQLLSIPSISSFGSNRESISAQSILRNMESFAREREAWKTGYRRPKDRRFKSMPAGARRPHLLKSDSSKTITPQSCAFMPFASSSSSAARERSKTQDAPPGLSDQQDQEHDQIHTVADETMDDSRRTDDLFRSPTPTRLHQRPRINTDVLPEFSFERDNRNDSQSMLDRSYRPRSSSLSALEHDSRYSMTSSGHLVGYGVAYGGISRDQLAGYHGRAPDDAEAEEAEEQEEDLTRVLRSSENSLLRRTARGEYYRLPLRHAPTPPDLLNMEEPGEESTEKVILQGQNAAASSPAPSITLQIQEDGQAGFIPVSREGSPEEDPAGLARSSHLSDSLQTPSDVRSRAGSSAHHSSTSAGSDDRQTNFADLFFHPPPPQDSRTSAATRTTDDPVAVRYRPDTVGSESSGVRQSLESGRVTEESHDSQHVVYVPREGAQMVRGLSGSQPQQSAAPQRDPTAASPAASSGAQNMVRVGSFKQPQKPAVIVEQTRHSFMPDLGEDEDEDEGVFHSGAVPRPRKFSTGSDNRSPSEHSFIEFDGSPPPSVQDYMSLRHQSSEQSFLEDFSPPDSPTAVEDKSEQTPRRKAAARRSSPTISQHLEGAEVQSPDFLSVTRGSYATSSASSLHVESFPRPPPHELPLPPSGPPSVPSRPSLYTQDSAATTRVSSNRQPELRPRPSLAHTDTDTTVYTFAPDTADNPSRSQVHLVTPSHASRSNTNFFTADSSGPSAYATPGEFESSGETPGEFLQEEYFSPRRRATGMTKSVSGPVARALEREADEDYQRNRTWSSSFIDFWRHSFVGDDEVVESQRPGNPSRRSSASVYSHARTYSDPISPRLQHRALDSPDESRG